MKIQVCMGKTCSERFCKYIVSRLENDRAFYAWKNLEIAEESCMGQCKKWPNIKVKNQILNYSTPIKASELVSKHIAEDAKKATSKKKK